MLHSVRRAGHFPPHTRLVKDLLLCTSKYKAVWLEVEAFSKTKIVSDPERWQASARKHPGATGGWLRPRKVQHTPKSGKRPRSKRNHRPLYGVCERNDTLKPCRSSADRKKGRITCYFGVRWFVSFAGLFAGHDLTLPRVGSGSFQYLTGRIRSGPVRSGPVGGSGRIGSSADRVGAGRIGSGRVGSVRVQSGPFGSGLVFGSGPFGSGRVGSGRVRSGPVGSVRVRSGRVGSGGFYPLTDRVGATLSRQGTGLMRDTTGVAIFTAAAAAAAAACCRW